MSGDGNVIIIGNLTNSYFISNNFTSAVQVGSATFTVIPTIRAHSLPTNVVAARSHAVFSYDGTYSVVTDGTTRNIFYSNNRGQSYRSLFTTGSSVLPTCCSISSTGKYIYYARGGNGNLLSIINHRTFLS
jgi:pSer/pThr/pTyr-binding forkhead associated (FHA) protein